MRNLLKVLKIILCIISFLWIVGLLLCPLPPDTRTKYIDDGKVINIIVDGKNVGTVG